ncbi:hypothetical protein EYF80_037979 [Liparis tanakae]|uniref:Uncharacterized protein n=1 Tax=Liparis tanakae TaxID=230148 RepID=A0A4Z2GF07_9TELE|nr:hypothetical protein EYF80_037979 [Liparis tanakae]
MLDSAIIRILQCCNDFDKSHLEGWELKKLGAGALSAAVDADGATSPRRRRPLKARLSVAEYAALLNRI